MHPYIQRLLDQGNDAEGFSQQLAVYSRGDTYDDLKVLFDHIAAKIGSLTCVIPDGVEHTKDQPRCWGFYTYNPLSVVEIAASYGLMGAKVKKGSMGSINWVYWPDIHFIKN